MNLTKYDIFFKVLETKTISQAAKDLGYSQSAVSQTIKSWLNRYIGDMLIYSTLMMSI